MCDEVGEEVCGFREVLSGLVWDGECEFNLVFFLDRPYENGALVVPRMVKRRGYSRRLLTHLSLIFRPRLIRNMGSPDESAVWDRRKQPRCDLGQGVQ